MAGVELLTDKAIQAALKGARASGKEHVLADGRGLSLQVRPNGAGWWRLRYWIAGRENRLSLGLYPAISLAEARKRRRDAQDQIAHGIDPSSHRKAAKAASIHHAEVARLAGAGLPQPGTFEFVAREWLERVQAVKVTAGHLERTRIRLEQDIFPWLGKRPLNEIDAPELLRCLRRVEARGAIETAHRIKDACGQVFRYGIAVGACRSNPAADLRDALRPVETRHHAAIVDPGQVAGLLRAITDYRGHPVTRAALRLSAMLLLRPGELRQIKWEEVRMNEAKILVPSDRMKRSKADKANGFPHVVPLATQAIAVLEDVRPFSGASEYVFPSLLSKDRCMSENTVRGALRRLGYANEDMTAHGFRAMARTMIAERLDVQPEVIEAQLAHAVPDALGRAYNRTQYLDQRTSMMQRWADYLESLQMPEGSAVVASTRKRLTYHE